MAGYSCTIVLGESRKIWWSGTNGNLNYVSELTEFPNNTTNNKVLK